jgi:hypothetical protein
MLFAVFIMQFEITLFKQIKYYVVIDIVSSWSHLPYALYPPAVTIFTR